MHVRAQFGSVSRVVSSLMVSGALAVSAALVLFTPSVAEAGIAACGNIDVRAEARCEVVVEGGCTVQCEPVRFEAACSAKLEASCRGQCTGSAEASCQGTCAADCQGRCEADPGSLDCAGSCKGSCEADCSGKCSSSGNRSECEASCKATCSGTCDAQCTGTPPSASCDAKCEASCQGSCQARANIDCQVDCQSSGYASCKAELEGGCKARCSQPEGALFCDGQYVDTGNNLQNCIDALRAALNIEVEGAASCSGNECTARGSASASCATSPVEAPLPGGLMALGVGALGAGIWRRRRRM